MYGKKNFTRGLFHFMGLLLMLGAAGVCRKGEGSRSRYAPLSAAGVCFRTF